VLSVDPDRLLAEVEATIPPRPSEIGLLLDSIEAYLGRFVVLSPHQLAAVSLWVVHTWTIDAADATAYVSITSPEKRSGKTRLLEVLSQLVARPWATGRTTAAVLVRKIHADHPTLLLDETDAAFRGDRDYAQALRQVLNLGHRRGGRASVCVGQGTGIRAQDFEVFGAKAIAGIGELPDTVADRSIPVRMERRSPGETIERFRFRQASADAQPICEALEAWAAKNVRALREARPDLPDALDDRAQDGWEPLLAIADAAGGDWPARARAAAVALHGDMSAEDPSFGVALLADIEAVFRERATDRISSVELLVGLVDREGPWAEWWGRAVRDKDTRGPGFRLARMLKRYGIRPKAMRTPSGTQRGYLAEDFADVWARYLPPVASQRRNDATPQVEAGGGPEAPQGKEPADTASDQAGYVVASSTTPHDVAQAAATLKRLFGDVEVEDRDSFDDLDAHFEGEA
jgi:Protein of unknown function (DUF3631)